MAEWPHAGETDPQADADMALLMDAIRAIRNARAERNVEAGKKLAVMIVSAEKADLFETAARRVEFPGAHRSPTRSYIADHLDAIPQGALPIVLGTATIYLPLVADDRCGGGTGAADERAEGHRRRRSSG